MPSSLPSRLLQVFVSLRTTVVLLTMLVVLLFLNIAVPQAKLFGEEAFAEIAGTSGFKHFFLVRAKFGYLSESPLFGIVLVAFYVNLALVLGRRVGPILRKLRRRPRKEAGLVAWAKTEGAWHAPLPGGWSARAAAHVVDALRGFGYRVERSGERAFWGVKHHSAPIGFLLFHMSFFLLMAGALLLWATRFDGRVQLAEGQLFDGTFDAVQRMPAVGGPPQVSFVLADVETRVEAGEPVHLGARVVFNPGTAPQAYDARVNQPATWGATTVLLHQAGLAPRFWLQDAAGFTVDREAVAASSVSVTSLAMADGLYLVSIEPVGQPFPERQALSSFGLGVEVIRSGDKESSRPAETVFTGTLRPGEIVDLGGERLVLEGLRYWVGVQVVRERGGGLLMAGFAIGIVGLIWRLMLYRREVAVVWDDETLRLVGSSEYFPERFRDELEAIGDVLRRPPSAVQDDSRQRNGGGGT